MGGLDTDVTMTGPAADILVLAQAGEPTAVDDFIAACQPPSQVMPTDTHSRDSQLYRMAVDIDNLAVDDARIALLADGDLGGVERQIAGYIQDNYELASGRVADRLFHASGSYYETYAEGIQILGTETADQFNPTRERRYLGTFGEIVQETAQSLMDGADPATARVEMQARLDAERQRLLETNGSIFNSISTMREDPGYVGCDDGTDGASLDSGVGGGMGMGAGTIRT